MNNPSDELLVFYDVITLDELKGYQGTQFLLQHVNTTHLYHKLCTWAAGVSRSML